MLCIIQKIYIYIYIYSRNFKMWIWTKAAKFRWVDSYGVSRKEVGWLWGHRKTYLYLYDLLFKKIYQNMTSKFTRPQIMGKKVSSRDFISIFLTLHLQRWHIETVKFIYCDGMLAARYERAVGFKQNCMCLVQIRIIIIARGTYWCLRTSFSHFPSPNSLNHYDGNHSKGDW